MAAKRSPAYIMTEFPIIIVGSQRPDDHRSVRSACIMVEFLTSLWDATTNLPIPELPSHKSVGQQLSQSFYIFPIPHTQTGNPGKTPFLPHPSQPLPEGPWDATQKSAKHA